MTAFTGSSSDNSHLTPMWKLAARNNQKPLVVVRRQSPPNKQHRVYWS